MNKSLIECIRFLSSAGDFPLNVGDGKVPSDLLEIVNEFRKLILTIADVGNIKPFDDWYKNDYLPAYYKDKNDFEKSLFEFDRKFPYDKHRHETVSSVIQLGHCYCSLFWILSENSEPQYRYDKVRDFVKFWTNDVLGVE